MGALLGPGGVVLPIPPVSDPPAFARLGRLLYTQLGIPRASAVSRVQAEAAAVGEGEALMLRSLGTNPTVVFVGPGRERRLLRHGETTVLSDGDGVGLFPNEAAPGSFTWVARPENARGDGGDDAARSLANVDDSRRVAPPSEDQPSSKRVKRTEEEVATADAREVKEAEAKEEALEEAPSECSRHGKPVVLILVGPPGAGKSTFCDRLPSAHWVSVNQDTIGGFGKKGSRKMCINSAKRGLNLGKNIVIDRCGLSVEQRADFVALARARGCEAHALRFDLPASTLHARVKARTNHPGNVEGEKGIKVVKRMMGLKDNAPPSMAEGFAEITTCVTDVEVDVAAARYAVIPRAGEMWNRRDEDAAAKEEECRGSGERLQMTNDGLADQRVVKRETKDGDEGGGGFAAAAGGVNAFAMMMSSASSPPLAAKTRGVKSPLTAEKQTSGPIAKTTSTQEAGKPPSAFDKLLASGARFIAEPAAKTTVKGTEKSKTGDGSSGGQSSLPQWKRGLVDIAASPGGKEGVVSFDDEFVVIRDKYPKARVHLLVLARDPGLIAGPSALRTCHVPLIERMLATARQAALAAYKHLRGPSIAGENHFRFGFHAVPSMAQLHLHVITQDLVGSGMKNRRHWNSFATDFFRDVDDVIKELREAGDGGLGWDDHEAEMRLSMCQLRCHRCGDGPHKNMPKLLEHARSCEILSQEFCATAVAASHLAE